MAQKRNPLLFLTDILNAIEKTEAHIQLGKQKLFENETIQDATFFRLQTAMRPRVVLRRKGMRIKTLVKQ